MQVGAQHVAVQHAVRLVVIIVAMADRRCHGAEWTNFLTQVCAAGMVLVADHRALRDRGGEDHVVDEAVARSALGAHRGHVDDAEALDRVLAQKPLAPQDLVAAADREQDAVVLDEARQVVAHAQQFLGREALLAVGAAAEEHDVGGGKVAGLAVLDAAHLHGDAALARTIGQDGHVAAVAVEVEQVGEQMGDDQRLLLGGGVRIRGGLRGCNGG